MHRFSFAGIDLEDLNAFRKFFFPWPVVITLTLCEVVYWTSPTWAQTIHFPTWEDQHRRAITECEDLLDREVTAQTMIVHDSQMSIPPEALADWTPQRVEAHFDSGLSVVSTLGQNGNLQTIVRGLHLPVGTTFRVWSGRIVQI